LSALELLGSTVREARARRFGLVTVLVVGGVILGVALRVWILASSAGALDGDEAVVGLMARHVLDGQVPTFYWGQSYGGTQETLVTAVLFWVFGEGSVVLKTVPILFWAGAALFVWRVGRRILGEPQARIAAVVFWISPAYFVWKSTKAHGFYGAGLVFGLWATLATLRLHERITRADLASFGLAAGLGWWATPESAILTVPALVWLLWTRPAVLRRAFVAAAGFLVGSLPWWLYNVRHNWAALWSAPASTSRIGRIGRLHDLLTSTLPTAIGVRLPFSLTWVPDLAVGGAVYALALAGFACLLVRRRERIGLPLLAALVFPLIYVASPYSWLATEPRYLTLLSPSLVLLLVSLASTRLRLLAVAVATAALSVAGLALMVSRNLAAMDTPLGLPADFRPLLKTLAANHVERVWASYWIAYRITFESDERIIAALPSSARYVLDRGEVHPADLAQIARQGRYAFYQLTVARARKTALVFAPRETVEDNARPVLRRAGYRLIRTDGLDVWLHP
jgi:hypothetical protein